MAAGLKALWRAALRIMTDATRSKNQERRRATRVAQRIPVAITDGGAELATETKNLSASGAFCQVDRFIAPMTKLQLRFELPDGSRRLTRIACTGVVVRAEPVIASADRGRFHVAIFFTELSERDRSAISKFVRQRLSATSSTA